VPVPGLCLPRRRALLWDAAFRTLVCALASVWLATPAAAQFSSSLMPGESQVRHGIRVGDVVLAHVQPTSAVGLQGAALRVTEGGRTRDIALDGTSTGARARGLDDIRYLPEYRRVVLHVDRHHDRSGLLIVDLATDAVVDAVVGRAFTRSPDGRYWIFEEYASLTQDQWPHTETVYAVYDAAAPPEQNARACPTSDERCRGQVLFLPDRLTRCHAIAQERVGPCLEPGRQPGHQRRSPFVWLGHQEVAWVDVDRGRQTSTLVLATLFGGMPADIRAVPLERERVIEDVDFPPAREPWTIERITRDADPSRVWLHFRTRIPQAPRQRLGVRLS
jgi:hypothetical protein